MSHLIRLGTLAGAFAVAASLGWWVVAPPALLWGWLTRGDSHPVREATIAAGLSWVGIMAWSASYGALPRMLEVAAAAMQVPVWALPVASLLQTMALAALGSWAGAGGGIAATKLWSRAPK